MWWCNMAKVIIEHFDFGDIWSMTVSENGFEYCLQSHEILGRIQWLISTVHDNEMLDEMVASSATLGEGNGYKNLREALIASWRFYRRTLRGSHG